MWRLEHIGILWFWLIIPATAFILYLLIQKRERKLNTFGNSKKIISLIQTESKWQSVVKKWIWSLAVILLVLALTNPQSGEEQESVTNKGSNVIIALDLSNSMLAKDIAPSRLERSKKFLQDLVRKLSGDRVAFIVFAGKAYVQMPFTTDYGTFEMQLNSVTTDMMPTQGTALREAIQMSSSLQGTENNPERILVLLSDGEDHDKGAVSQAKKAAENHLLIHTIGIGTSSGAPVPETLSDGEVRYKKDDAGNQVISKLNEKTLQEIATAGGGKYFNINNEKNALKEIQKSIKWSKSATGEEKVYTRYKNYFQYFLFPAIILLMLEIAGVHILTFRTNKNQMTSLLVLLSCSIFLSCNENDRVTAFQNYQKGNFPEATNLYKKIAEKDSSAENLFNLATSLYFQKLPDSATALYERVLKLQPEKSIIANTFFNKANIAIATKDYQTALDNLKKSLEFSPGNYRAQYNLSIVLSLMDNQDKSQEPRTKSQDENQDKNQEPRAKNQDQDKSQEPRDKKQDKNQNQDQNQDKDQDPRGKDQDSKGKNQEPRTKNQDKNQTQAPRPSKLSSQAVEQLFQALDQQEKNIQLRHIKKENERSGTIQVEKDW
ncbi:MAG: VWA domain-containing protein [Chitinophagales bacterium]|nr:VWA domain-containing protein [Chitinophagales bacterium]